MLNELIVHGAVFSDGVVHGAILPYGAVPDPGTGEAPPGAEGFLLILRWAFWIGLAVCVGGLIAAGAYMSFSFSRGEGGEHVGRILKVLGGVVIIAAATSLISGLVTASA